MYMVMILEEENSPHPHCTFCELFCRGQPLNVTIPTLPCVPRRLIGKAAGWLDRRSVQYWKPMFVNKTITLPMWNHASILAYSSRPRMKNGRWWCPTFISTRRSGLGCHRSWYVRGWIHRRPSHSLSRCSRLSYSLDRKHRWLPPISSGR